MKTIFDKEMSTARTIVDTFRKTVVKVSEDKLVDSMLNMFAQAYRLIYIEKENKSFILTFTKEI